MNITRIFVFTAVAVAVLSAGAVAGETALPARRAPAKEDIKTELARPATSQIKTPDAGYTDFDALSAINDPLYREGARALLKQVSKDDAAAAAKPVLRDAPNSRPASLIKRPRVKKALPVDPVKVKNTL
ncbi:MAG: hypothetical protein A2234_01560 [Elusimicrobia bacterium RIFOXYA2_FULL_58_8]|nr:MAG: hypothetical protein A2234_01560 [Elusimicrobia bacterium RIFOXYA2_FULL_58_8]